MTVDQPDLDLIDHGEIVSCQLTPGGSNYTFLAQLELNGRNGLAIYKPRDGEAPLWDFPRGSLYKRECAAYLLSQVLGWNFIPYTVIRDGPYGIGSVQRYIEHDPKQNYYTLTDDNAAQLKLVACFDLVANSTDRKANHLLVGNDGKLWSIDHGLTFHADTKIRTVIWDFSGQRIPKSHLAKLGKLAAQLEEPKDHLKELLDLLLPEEVEGLRRRVEWVLSEGVYPGVPGRSRGRRY
ncbi:MAG: hypothetical protein IH962_05395 [Chloroflexi bacterium]|nr:hypothetical protein [Chloroflexota bacterium]